MGSHDEGLKEPPVQYNHAGEWADCANSSFQQTFPSLSLYTPNSSIGHKHILLIPKTTIIL